MKKIIQTFFSIYLLIILSSRCFPQIKKGDGPPVTRSNIILTADKYARVHWRMSEENRTGKSPNSRFRSNYHVGDRIGMAYKWSGWDTVEDFLKKIKAGYGAGTGGGSGTYNNYSINDVIGISCTGLVSRAWHLRNKYTLNYPNPNIRRKFQEITHDIEGIDFGNNQLEELRKGDAFINWHHIILFLYKGRDGNLRVIDSSTPGVRFRTIGITYLKKSKYTSIRYNNIREITNPKGTIVNPIKIVLSEDGFKTEGNTRDVVSMEFDSYSISPEKSQVGPEVIYEFDLNTPKILEIKITDFKDEGIDNDIHLLSSLRKNDKLMAVDCIAFGDNNITKQLIRGTYYIAVDSKNDLPGEYTLTIKFK